MCAMRGHGMEEGVMADFCWDCTEKMGDDPSLNDLDRTGRGNYQYMDLCETCGWGYFDEQGKRVGDLQA
jgi:hypothetical protein